MSHAQRLQARGEDVGAYLCAFGPEDQEHWHVGHPRGSKRAPRALPAYGSSKQIRKLLNRALEVAHLSLLGAAALLLALSIEVVEAQERTYTADDTLEAVRGAPYPIACLVYYETWPHWDPYSVGSAGELGAAQLHPRGELPNFLYADWTPLPSAYRDPFSPYQAVAFLEHYGATHGWRFDPWSTWRLCR